MSDFIHRLPDFLANHLYLTLGFIGVLVALLVTEALAAHPAFADYRRIAISAADEYAGNTLRVNGTLITPAGYPRVHDAIGSLGLPLHVIDASEFRKMDGGLTCLSLRF